MKALLCQINTTPGDFKGNVNKIEIGIAKTLNEDVDIVIFPELTIPGYLCKDLMYESNFVVKNLEFLQHIVSLSNNINPYIVVGYIDANHTGKGKPFRNMLAVIKQGRIVGTYQKRLLPFYDVFDEGRYFEPGKDTLVLDIDGERVGFAICEDLWANCKGETDLYNYETNPVTIYKNLGVNTIISINSSPYTKEKPEFRLNMLQGIAEENLMSLIYVNQVGGQDDLVFDGHSCVISFERGVIHQLKNNECYELVSTKDCALAGYNNIVADRDQNLYDMLVTGIRDYVTKCGFKSVVLGSSGGIDSALVATLACKAIGAENVNCIMMPSCYSSEGSVKDAHQLHKNLGCKEFEVPIDHRIYVDKIKYGLGFRELKIVNVNDHTKIEKIVDTVEINPVADENIQSRMRGNIIMYYANAMNSLAIGTSNKCESAVGYFTVFGDTANFFNPLIDLYKMEIYDLAKWINHIEGRAGIPQEIIDKAPSAELAPGQTDEKSLLPYPLLDKIVEMYIEKYINTCDNFMKETLMEVKREDYDRIIRLISINQNKNDCESIINNQKYL